MRIVLPAARSEHVAGAARAAGIATVGNGQVDGERGAFAEIAGDGNVSAALRDDAVDRRETEPRPAVGILRREERLEDSGARLFAHADAVSRTSSTTYRPAGRTASGALVGAISTFRVADAERAAAASSRRAHSATGSAAPARADRDRREWSRPAARAPSRRECRRRAAGE